MQKSVLMLSTLDTKFDETMYLKTKIESLDMRSILMDISMRGERNPQADIFPSDVASAAGSSIEEIRRLNERSQITDIVIKGASKIARGLMQDQKLNGVLAIGGSTGSLIATEVMRAFPFGFPKLMISSTAALPGLSTRYIGSGDMMLFHSVIEISGVTDLLKNVMDRAACAMAGMVHGLITLPAVEKGRSIALTMMGPCEKCASLTRASLVERGYQVIGFSAAGIGDRAMEEMIAQGFFQGVVDLAPGGVGEHLFGFMRDAGPDRMESAGKMGIPQIISTCSVNHMTPSKSRYKPEHLQRRRYNLDKYRTWLRLSTDELEKVAETFAKKLNGATGPVKIVIPLRGWSSADREGSETYDPEEDKIFTRRLKEMLKPGIEVIEVDANMEDPLFAEAIVKAVVDAFSI
jgi:uncharacterized protein (UPF0261 family)